MAVSERAQVKNGLRMYALACVITLQLTTYYTTKLSQGQQFQRQCERAKIKMLCAFVAAGGMRKCQFTRKKIYEALMMAEREAKKAEARRALQDFADFLISIRTTVRES